MSEIASNITAIRKIYSRKYSVSFMLSYIMESTIQLSGLSILNSFHFMNEMIKIEMMCSYRVPVPGTHSSVRISKLMVLFFPVKKVVR